MPLGGGQGSHDLLFPETPQSPVGICRVQVENKDGLKRFYKSWPETNLPSQQRILPFSLRCGSQLSHEA